ncbi:aldo/keto reductase [Stenotrophomonas maltophilia]|uniref:aldo/keto reductase n=1 Tax=Stenotrophomonas maltophilia TaxID=40324 RepID=UPI0018D3468A|nr:aldo/keto reductase [Stenotrophomonas maltophilia]MBH1817201.1 aldo/keto reductase [Stenotrophomonas maltophilia]MCU1027715.1 aldo/keto reductase [Stenotrophomonas maltophilia]
MRDSSRTPRAQLGLGCSRLGSVNGVAGPDAASLLSAALDEGYRFFDTSNIYGQGDSERLIGNVIGNRSDCVVCTKGGKYLPFPKRILVPVKGLIRLVARRSNTARNGVSSLRSQPLPTRWDTDFISAAIDGSLRRLRRDAIDIYLLHSPHESALSDGEAIRALHKAQRAGKVHVVGVSVDDVGTAMAALRDPRVGALQLPLHPGVHDYDQVLEQAFQQGVKIIAREVLGGQSAIAVAQSPSAYATARIRELQDDPRIATVLVGTTKISNMKVAARAAGLTAGTSA